FQLRF
ncbi:hypothetical protein RRG08_013574, partial [Elysia crispata]